MLLNPRVVKVGLDLKTETKNIVIHSKARRQTSAHTCLGVGGRKRRTLGHFRRWHQGQAGMYAKTFTACSLLFIYGDMGICFIPLQ